tara:strand:+ start:60 stop:761 length:702 start_codon:yes stop_codon:yes gene_type:complete
MGEYSGNHPRFSRRQEERYDAKEAHNKDLSASARLHYLENDETHHPAKNLADSRDIKDMSGAYNAMGDPNSPAPHKGAMKGDQSATHTDYAHYKGTDPNYHGHTGASHGDQSATHRDYMHGHPAKQNIFRKGFDFGKKVLRTGARTLGDLGVQAVDLLTPDPGHTGGGSNVGFTLGGSRAAGDEAYRQKRYEQDHFAKTRQMAKEGKIFDIGTSSLFDDTDAYVTNPNKKRGN